MAEKGPKPKRQHKGRVSPTDRRAALRSAAEELTNPQGAPDWRAALRDFTAALRELYGSRLDSVILYGSRARGDAEPLSDVDTLVVLKDCPDFWAEFHRISPIANRVSLAYGVVVSALPATVEELADSQGPLFMNVRREGQRVA